MGFFKGSPYKPLFDKNKKRISASELRDVLDPNTPILLTIGHSEWVTLARRRRFLSLVKGCLRHPLLVRAIKYIPFLCKLLQE